MFVVSSYYIWGGGEFVTQQEITCTISFLYLKKKLNYVMYMYGEDWELACRDRCVEGEHPTANGLSGLQNSERRKIALFISILFEFITISPYHFHSLNTYFLGIFLYNYPCIMFLTGNSEVLLCLAKCGDGFFTDPLTRSLSCKWYIVSRTETPPMK